MHQLAKKKDTRSIEAISKLTTGLHSLNGGVYSLGRGKILFHYSSTVSLEERLRGLVSVATKVQIHTVLPAVVERQALVVADKVDDSCAIHGPTLFYDEGVGVLFLGVLSRTSGGYDFIVPEESSIDQIMTMLSSFATKDGVGATYDQGVVLLDTETMSALCVFSDLEGIAKDYFTDSPVYSCRILNIIEDPFTHPNDIIVNIPELDRHVVASQKIRYDETVVHISRDVLESPRFKELRFKCYPVEGTSDTVRVYVYPDASSAAAKISGQPKKLNDRFIVSEDALREVRSSLISKQ